MRILTYDNGGYISIPSLLSTIQDRLLDCISVVLSRSHYAQARPSFAMSRGNMTNATQQVTELSDSALVQLALQTLARFNFKVFVIAFSGMLPAFSMSLHCEATICSRDMNFSSAQGIQL